MSLSKPTSNDGLKVRETMFEFLKRKKQNQQEKSIIQYGDSSKKSFEYSANRSVLSRDYQSREKSSVAYDDFVVEEHSSIPLVSNKKYKLANTMSITPRKITFAGDQVAERLPSSRKPLLDMISPNRNTNRSSIKNTGSLSKYARENEKFEQKQLPNPRKSILKSTSMVKNNNDPFSKRRINVSLDNLGETFQRMFEAGQTAKEKNKELSIALINFVKDLQKNKGRQNFPTQKKLGDIKYILNSIDSALLVFDQHRAARQIVEEFQKAFSQHLNEIESGTNHNVKQQYEQEIMRITNQKQSQIDELYARTHKLERQIQKLNKLMEKSQREYDNQLQQYQERQQNLLGTIDNLKRQNEEIQQQAMERSQQLQRMLEDQRENSKCLEKQLKDVLYKDKKNITEEEVKRMEEAAARQAFLLEEMESLRRTFNTDISELHKLYQTKQIQFQKKVQELSIELEQEKHQRKCDRQVSDRILAEANLSRGGTQKITKKNEQLLQDLYRMNEDLFQHWLALKDIRTLSERLHIFQHFERIYLDLAFNPNLFRV